MSCITLSGTWLILLASILLAFSLQSPFPGWWTMGIFLFVCIAVEAIEFVASYFGITKRGGSKTAGIMAAIGGFAGMTLGSLVLPIIGTLIGMLIGSFALAYLVERHKIKKSNDEAVGVAMGAVLAKLAVIILKVAATLGMIIALIMGMIGAGN
ncbi:hypothetical protein BVX97_03565 [bacterium E08(2017)]|nr:hypothetical protein BVX97_03565 [bacterium E08(2017)]